MNMQAQARDMRAREHYPYIDTYLIGPNASNVRGWDETFQQAGQRSEINFFNIRNEADAGSMYNNQDTEGDLDVGYLIESIGIEVIMPPISGKFTETPPEGTAMLHSYALWADMINASSFKFYIGQDEVVSAPADTMPAGYGVLGNWRSIHNQEEIDGTLGTSGILTNGWPEMKNRWTFAKPKEVPRNRNIKGVFVLSDIWRDNLQQMDGPGWIQASIENGVSGRGWVPARCGLRVTLNGTRIVQLRNANSYY